MKSVTKIVAIACIFSILLTGCYISTLIEPTGDEKQKIYTHEIAYIITKDGTKHEFATKPTITKDAIVGTTKESVSIPLVNVVEFNTGVETRTTYQDKVYFIVTKDSTKYMFQTPPTMTPDDVIVGVGFRSVSIPLSDVSQVYVKEFSLGATMWFVLGTIPVIFYVVGKILFSSW